MAVSPCAFRLAPASTSARISSDPEFRGPATLAPSRLPIADKRATVSVRYREVPAVARDRTSGLPKAQDAGRRTEPQRLGIDSGEPPGGGNRTAHTMSKSPTTTGDERMTTSHRAPLHPAEVLLEEVVKPLDMSVNQLALALGIGATRLNEVVRGRRGITGSTMPGAGSAADPFSPSVFRPAAASRGCPRWPEPGWPSPAPPCNRARGVRSAWRVLRARAGGRGCAIPPAP